MQLNLCVLAIFLLSIGSTLVQAAIDKKFHLVTTSKMNWHEALHYCNSRDMRLAALFSKEESDHLEKQINDAGIRDFFWTAGTCLGNEPYFYWMGHTKPMTFTNWNRGEPNNIPGFEDCFELSPYTNFKWNDVPCSNKMFAICEEKISPLPGSLSLHDTLNSRAQLN